MDAKIIRWADGIFDERMLDTSIDAEEAAFLLRKNKKGFLKKL